MLCPSKGSPYYFVLSELLGVGGGKISENFLNTQTQTQRERERQTDRQTDRQRQRERQRETHRERDREKIETALNYN